MRLVFFRHDEPDEIAEVYAIGIVPVRRVSHATEDERVHSMRGVARKLVESQKVPLTGV